MAQASTSPVAGTAHPLPDVLEEHLEDLAGLCVQRRKLCFSPDAPLRALRRHERRIEAHRDGLRVGGAKSVEIAIPDLEEDDLWTVFVAAWVWIEQSGVGAAELCNALARVPAVRAPAWREALRRSRSGAMHAGLAGDAWRELPVDAQAIVLDARFWHGEPTSELGSLAASSHADLRRCVARHTKDAGLARTLSQDSDVGVRRAALWSLTLADAEAGHNRALELASARDPDPFAIRVLGLRGSPADGRKLVELVAVPTVCQASLFALGDLGQLEWVALLLEVAERGSDEDALVALTAYQRILGGDVPDKRPVAKEAGIPQRASWEERLPRLDTTRAHAYGTALPWSGVPADEPMELLWRRCLAAPSADSAWLAREVPDGFFTGLPRADAVPGE